MQIVDLKRELETGILPDTFLILQCDEDFFIANQYIDAICDKKNLEKVVCSSLIEVSSKLNSLFTCPSLFIIKCESFTELLLDYSDFNNTVVICSEVDKKVKPLVSEYLVEIPKLKDWQVIAYIQHNCPDISATGAKWLYEAAEGNIFKIQTEIDKLKLFSGSDQQGLLQCMQFEPSSDLYSISTFSYAEAIINKNYNLVQSALSHRHCCNLDPLAIVSILLGTFKKILLVNYSVNPNLEVLSITPKQANGIRYYYPPSVCSYDRAIYCIQFLSQIDLRIKQGKLDMPKDWLLDYITTSLL